MSGAKPPSSAAQIRERGNKLYKKGALSEGKNYRFQVRPPKAASIDLLITI